MKSGEKEIAAKNSKIKEEKNLILKSYLEILKQDYLFKGAVLKGAF